MQRTQSNVGKLACPPRVDGVYRVRWVDKRGCKLTPALALPNTRHLASGFCRVRILAL